MDRKTEIERDLKYSEKGIGRRIKQRERLTQRDKIYFTLLIGSVFSVGTLVNVIHIGIGIGLGSWDRLGQLSMGT